MFWDWVAHSVWAWLGMTGVILVGCGLVAYFIPGFRKTAIGVAVGTLTVFGLLAKGYRDGQKKTQAKWDDAETKSVERGETAATKAEQQVAKDQQQGKVTDKFDREDL